MSWRDVVVESCFWLLASLAVIGCTTLLYLASGWPPVLLLIISIISIIIVPSLLIGGALASDKLSETSFYVQALFALVGCGQLLHMQFDLPLVSLKTVLLGMVIVTLIYHIGAVLSDAPDYEGN